MTIFFAWHYMLVAVFVFKKNTTFQQSFVNPNTDNRTLQKEQFISYFQHTTCYDNPLGVNDRERLNHYIYNLHTHISFVEVRRGFPLMKCPPGVIY